jgi:transcriptional regulator with XRE-family HTH domain
MSCRVQPDETSIDVMSLDPDLTFGERLHQLRLRRGLSKEAVAAQAYVTLRAVDYWEAGTRNPQLETLTRLARAMNCTVEWLATGRGPSPLRRAVEVSA